MQGQGDVHRQGLVCQLGGCEEWLLFEDLPWRKPCSLWVAVPQVLFGVKVVGCWGQWLRSIR